MPQYIRISKSGTLSLVQSAPAKSICIPDVEKEFRNHKDWKNATLTKVSQRLSVATSDIKSEWLRNTRGQEIQFCSQAPEPWFLALGYIMYEGILQGLSWDAVKHTVMQGLSFLQTNALVRNSGDPAPALGSTSFPIKAGKRPVPKLAKDAALSFTSIEVLGKVFLSLTRYKETSRHFETDDRVAPKRQAKKPSAAAGNKVKAPRKKKGRKKS